MDIDIDITPTNSPYNAYYSPQSVSSNPPTPTSLSDTSPRPAEKRQPRQRLRPWLIDQINKGDISGLVWLDRDELKFKIPWKHFGRPGINEFADAALFRRWAIHTKKFQEGDNSDISTWKTRFRCALHKLPDIEELHECNQKDGDDPYRVYRFIKKEIEVENAPTCQGASSCSSSSSDKKESVSSESIPSCQSSSAWTKPGDDFNLPINVESYNDELLEFGDIYLPSIDPDLEKILNGQDSMQVENKACMEYRSLVDININHLNTEAPQQRHHERQEEPQGQQHQPSLEQHPYQQQDQQKHQQLQQPYPQHHLHHHQQQHQQLQQQLQEQQQLQHQRQLQQQLQIQQLQSQQEQMLRPVVTLNQTLQTINSAQFSFLEELSNSVEIKLYYKDKQIANQIVDNPNGVRIAFKPPPLLPQDVVQEAVSNIYGPASAEQILFPSTDDPYAAKILGCIKRGLVLQFRDGQVLATRLCQAKVYYSKSEIACNDELPRQHTVVVFDYKHDFLQKFNQYKSGDGERPLYERYFSFAQPWSSNSPLTKNYVRFTMTHCFAQQKFKEFENQRPIDIKLSSLNQFDILAQQIEGLNL